MALLNFKKQFVPKIESGEKTHTIRATRKTPIRAGETLHLYTGLRQKGTRLLMRVPCTRVQPIRIETVRDGAVMAIDGQWYTQSECQQVAIRDGFANWDEMVAFFADRLPFTGQIIHWDFPGAAK